MSDLKKFKASENPSIHEGKHKRARHTVVMCQNCESSTWSCNKKLPQLPLVVHHKFYWLLLYIVGTRLPNLQDDYWLCTKTWHSVWCMILILRFPYDVRTEFTDFKFSTENNVIWSCAPDFANTRRSVLCEWSLPAGCSASAKWSYQRLWHQQNIQIVSRFLLVFTGFQVPRNLELGNLETARYIIDNASNKVYIHLITIALQERWRDWVWNGGLYICKSFRVSFPEHSDIMWPVECSGKLTLSR